MLDRPIEKAKDATDQIVEDTKVLCPWLPDPERCPECKIYMDATEDFVAEQAAIMPIWECPECGHRAYRVVEGYSNS